MATVRINNSGNTKDELAPIVEKEQVIVQKKSLGAKFADAFISDAAKDLKSYILWDVFVPGVKDAIMNGLNMIFYGSTTSRSRRPYGGYSDNTPYRSFYQSDYDGYGAPPRRNSQYGRRYDRDPYGDKIDYRNIIVRDRTSAEEIVNTLRGRIKKYGEATKADLLELIDIPSTSVDNNWGWVDPRNIGIRRVSTGYLIDVADAEFLGD